jgi:hypothetical protein
MRQLHSQSSPFCLNSSGVLADYTWDSLGRLTSLKYPSYHVNNGGTYTPVTGATHVYQYDAMYRPYSMTENGVTLATGAQYGPAHELTQPVYEGWTETRQYNALLQLTRITVPGAIDFEYRYFGPPQHRPHHPVQGPGHR